MTMTNTAGDVQIVAMTMTVAEVRLTVGRTVESIGRVSTNAGRWYWQHRDGEQSSPIADNRAEAATALVNYHRAFKPRPAPAPAPAEGSSAVRRLLFA
jgi:hypothetical protein